MPRDGTSPTTTANIGVGFGLLAWLIGIGQWVLMARDYAARLAALQAAQSRAPGSFIDATSVYRGNDEYWLITALVTAGMMLLLCLLAAFAAGWVAPHCDGGPFAAWVAAEIAMLSYIIATGVSLASIPFP